MSLENPSSTVTGNAIVVFRCGGCGLSLSVDRQKAGVSGPCPSCGTWLTSPILADVVAPDGLDGLHLPPTGGGVRIPSRRSSPGTPARSKGRIPADSIIDHAHLEQRESAKTLKVLALFVLVICACVAAAWFMKDSMAK